ncbi:hypothetical protein BDL97_04G026300 [Sphagnum fallax]|nr:hypothetical protein BDL97_04G026300 [Sphagnum fallax]KAH8963685.1 hypothetical protein BDL97_04G026300 [Sphagnum fallax]KAH8963689.1 hypothetical protein BDL97_04G026300 [Sphagnum fallax]KAH8963690.1 hypothetical protein BDL97_04G026300 [Sphagnum fallax]
MAASPLANHTALVLLQQAIPSRCPYPRSTVHNSNLCPHLRSSHIAERNLQIEKHQRKHFQHSSGSPFLIAAVKKGENADVLDGIGSQEGARFSQRSRISDDGANAWLGERNQLFVAGKGADGSHSKLSERLQLAVDDDAASAVMEARFAIDTALTAADTAKEQAQIAEATLLEHIGLLHELSCTEKKVLSVEESLLSAVHQLEVANTAIEHLQIELEAAKALTKAGGAHIIAAESSVHEVQLAADKAADESENNSRHSVEVLMNAAAVRKESAQITFNAKSEVLQAMKVSGKNSDKVQAEANLLRYTILEKSLAAAEAAAEAWKTRATNAEGILRQAKELGIETLSSKSTVEQITGGGRMEMLLEKDSRRRHLLSNGPRREIPEWMKRRLDVGQQGLPPRESLPSSADVKAMLPLELPSPEDVWSIAHAKVKADIYTAQAMEKQALDLQRKVLERALERKSDKKQVKDPEEAEGKLASGTGTGHEIVFQGFNWESWRRDWWLELSPKAADLSRCGITTIWLPPPTHSVAPQGYMPGDLYNMNSAYGTEDELKQCIAEMHNHNILVLGDVVLNHRCAQKQGPNGVWNVFGGKLDWGPEAIVRDDPNFQGHGNPSSGDFFHAAPNIDHSQAFVRKDIKEWMKWLRHDFQFDGWRLDFVRGFWGGYVKEYIETTKPAFAIGEYWDSLAYEGGQVCYNQDSHRQRIINWINAAGGTSSAFDVTTKGILHSALHGEFWRLIDPQGKPPGVMGWWPSRAVTFLENHDTGSTQGHWPFPRDKIMMGYAYILTHPGTPVVFYDHFYDFGLRDQIAELIAVRTRTGVHCRSTVKIFQANFEGYVAQVGEDLVMKIGHLDWNPSKQNNLTGSWEQCIDRDGYQLWERK